MGDSNKGTLCLPDNQHPVQPGTACDVVGWGDLSYRGGTPKTLQHVQLPIVSLEECNTPKVYNGKVNELNLCAGFSQGGKGACHGDSGGALTCEREGRHYAEGIVYGGFECARPNAYELFTDVAKMKAWIVKTIVNIKGRRCSGIKRCL